MALQKVFKIKEENALKEMVYHPQVDQVWMENALKKILCFPQVDKVWMDNTLNKIYFSQLGIALRTKASKIKKENALNMCGNASWASLIHLTADAITCLHQPCI